MGWLYMYIVFLLYEEYISTRNIANHFNPNIMKKLMYIIVAIFIFGPILSSCSSSRGMCKSKKKYYKSQKCWNTKKQRMVKC